MQIESCLKSNAARNDDSKDCTYLDFVAYINSLSIQGKDLDAMCMEKFVPPTNNW